MAQKHMRLGRERSVIDSVSYFTLSLLAVALIYSTLMIYTVVTVGSDCHFAFFWLDGWFDWKSNFQLVCAAIAALIVLWVFRLISSDSEVLSIAVCQGVFLTTLAVVLVVHKAFLLPFGTPDWAAVDRLLPVEYVKPPLLIHQDPILEPSFDWPYDFPPPPKYPEYPERNPDGMQEDLSKVFRTSKSPLWSEFKELRACMRESDQAIVDFFVAEAEFRRWHEHYGWSVAHCGGMAFSGHNCEFPSVRPK